MNDLGEKAFLSALLPHLHVAPTFVNGFGDDASVIDLGWQEQLLVMKIDRAGSPIAANRGWSDYRMWGRLAVTANCNDILAVGGRPLAMMVCVCIPGSWSTQDVTDIILGCQEECRRWGIAFVGGDTKEAARPEVVGSAVGLVEREKYLSRTGGQPGQFLVLAGLIGGYIGSYLQLLYQTEEAVSDQQRAAWIEYITSPRVKWQEAEIVRGCGGARAGVDTSDGLYDTLLSLTGKGIGVEIDLSAVPYHPSMLECARLLQVPLFNAALGIGDWDLVYVVDGHYIDELLAKAHVQQAQLAVIGRLTEAPGIFAKDGKGNRYRIEGMINENFRSRAEDQGDFMEQLRSRNPLHPDPD